VASPFTYSANKKNETTKSVIQICVIITIIKS